MQKKKKDATHQLQLQNQLIVLLVKKSRLWRNINHINNAGINQQTTRTAHLLSGFVGDHLLIGQNMR